MKPHIGEKPAPVIAVHLQWPIGAFRLGPDSLALLRKLVPASAKLEICRSRAALLRALPDATHALVWEFDAKWFARAPKLRVLATPSAGRELLPSDEDIPYGVVKWHGRFHGPIMAETVIAAMLAHCRGLWAAKKFQDEGSLWARGAMSPFCRTLAGTKAVILGYGSIGRVVGEKLSALGVSFTGIGRSNISLLDSLLPETDWLIMALPSDTGTDGILSKKRISLLPKRAYIVNVGRGNSIDEAALAQALRKGRIAGAALDVFSREPLDSGNPLSDNTIPNLLRIPHASAFSPDYLSRFFKELSQNGLLS